MKNIIKNVKILHKNGLKQIFDAIKITNQGIYTGQILSEDEHGEVFEDFGFIPRDQIQKIIVFDEEGKCKDINFWKGEGGGKNIFKKEV